MKVQAKRGSAAAAVVALLLTTLGTLVFPGTAGAAVVRAGGVTGVQVNGTGGGDGLSYVGLYELTDPVTGKRQATCIEWDGRAPDDQPGAYLDGGLTDDPILSALAFTVDNLSGPFKDDEVAQAALAVVGKYRSSQLGLPGATTYPVGLPDPTSGADFRLSDGSGGVRTFNGNQASSAGAVAATAMFAWTVMENTGRDWAWTLDSATPHPGVDGGVIDTEWTLRNAAGNPVGNSQPILAPPGLQSNVTVDGFYDDAFDQKLTDYGFPAPLTSSDGKAYLRVNVVDGTKPVSYGVSIVGPSSARVLRPVDERQQTMIVAGTPKVAQADGRQEAPLGTVRIGKLDGVTGDPVAGATLRLTGPGGYDETFTSPTSLIEIPDVRVGNYRLTETAPPPGYITETPEPTVTGLLDRDAELTLTVDNYREIDGQTTASESVVTSQGDTQVFDEITVTGVDDDQEVEAVCPQCGPTPF